MASRLKKFISAEFSLINARAGQAMTMFARKMVLISIVLAMLVSVTVLLVAYFFDLLPLPLSEALAYSVVMAWLVGGVVAALLSVVLSQSIMHLSKSNERFERLSRTDALSGLMNRRSFNKSFEETQDNASLAIFDLDHFKSINDGFGHAIGDNVIRRVAHVISDVFGSTHSVARLGGEEFAVVIRGGEASDRLALADLTRHRVSKLELFSAEQKIQVTISAGVAEIDTSRSKHEIFTAADSAMYLAKAAGKNRTFHENDHPDLKLKSLNTDTLQVAS